MATNDEETFWVLGENDAIFARKVSGRNLKFKKRKAKGNQEAKRAVTNEVASNLFAKAAPAGRPIWPTKIRIPTTRHTGEKAKERKGREEKQKSSIPVMETKVIHPMTVAKEKADMTKDNPKRSQPRQRIWRAVRQSEYCTIHRAYKCRLDRPRLGSIIELE